MITKNDIRSLNGTPFKGDFITYDPTIKDEYKTYDGLIWLRDSVTDEIIARYSVQYNCWILREKF